MVTKDVKFSKTITQFVFFHYHSLAFDQISIVHNCSLCPFQMDGATLAEMEKEDARLLAEAKLYKLPTPPEKFNPKVVRDQAETEMTKSRRLPGEPKITVSLSETTTITLDSACPA